MGGMLSRRFFCFVIRSLSCRIMPSLIPTATKPGRVVQQFLVMECGCERITSTSRWFMKHCWSTTGRPPCPLCARNVPLPNGHKLCFMRLAAQRCVCLF